MSSLSETPVMVLQINIIDPIAREPMAQFDPDILKYNGNQIVKVPLIQIFGTSTTGAKEVVIVHGIFPTIYIDYPVKESEDIEFKSQLLRHIEREFKGQVIYSFSITTAIPVYGFHLAQKFLKIELVQPTHLQQLAYHIATFVWNGKPIRAYEAHIPYFLQFFRQCNLTGCGLMSLSRIIRIPSKETKYANEIHISVSDIIQVPTNNRSQILTHLGPIWEDQKKIRRKMNVDTQLPVTITSRRDLLFTQKRIPDPSPSQLQSSQELNNLLEFIEKYDPDAKIESIEKEIQKTQLEIQAIIDENAPLYKTPKSFVAGRISQAPQMSLSQESQAINPFPMQLVTQNYTSVFEEEKFEKNVQAEPPPEPSSSQEKSLSQDAFHSVQSVDILHVEIGTATRTSLLPDPKYDAVLCIVYAITVDQDIKEEGAFYFGSQCNCGIHVYYYDNEVAMFNAFTDFVVRKDPEIIAGFNVENESMGYLKDRAELLGIQGWFDNISRMKISVPAFDECRKIGGRMLVNIWRVIRHKEPLRNYSLTNVADKILGAPFPYYRPAALMAWHQTAPHRYIMTCVQKLHTVIAIVNKMCLFEQYIELAFVIGLDMCSALARGSQAYIESLLCRVSYRLGFLLYSPTKKDVAGSRAPMALPLVMEPLSGYYSDPVMVLDFTSLYPSALIAYNLDYSTCMGRSDIVFTGGQMGCTDYKVSPEKLQELLGKEKIINTPNDVLFVKSDVRRGVLPILLQNILDLRAYIKQTLKYTTDEKMKRILSARQEALKMYAACTYGYTSAHYSGRMPCVDLGDSIVECSRHMVEFVISVIEKNYSELKVLYGDTDSLFIMMPPASIEKCFEFATKMCDEISSYFPHPVKIKIEKIFFGCFLVNKKRYCGWIYESPTQKEHTLDVKGLEMKRRDSCVLVKNVMTQVVESIFRTKSAELAEKVFIDYMQRICRGDVPLYEFMFAKELRLGTYKALEPPGAFVVRRQMERDPRAAPLYGERIQYVVVSNVPGARLVDKVLSPQEYVSKKARINTRYYIERQIMPALGRVLETMGIDINKWMNGKNRELRKLGMYSFNKQVTAMERFCKSTQCPLCNKLQQSTVPLCSECLTSGGRPGSLFELIKRMKSQQSIMEKCNRKCMRCINLMGIARSSVFCSHCDNYWEYQLSQEKNEVLDSYKKPLCDLFAKSKSPARNPNK